MTTPMMECGHAANATHNGAPACVICAGISGGANLRVATVAPDLTGRRARCGYRVQGKSLKPEPAGAHDPDGVPSSADLWFFEYRPNEPFDSFYCGCHGTD